MMPLAPLLKTALRPALDYALPPRCPGCGAIVGEDFAFCLDCWSGMEFLGRVAFQPPVPAYKHGAAMVKKMRGWYTTDHLLPNNPFVRDDAHREELRAALQYLEVV